MRKNKLALFDVDGVALYWLEAFERYMKLRGFEPLYKESNMYDLTPYFGLKPSDGDISEYITEFNNGHWEFGTLKPLDGAVAGIRKIKDAGFRIDFITSCSSHAQTVALRKANLYNVFGDVFTEVHCVDVGESKRTHLSSYEPAFWVEDKASAAEDGLEYGHTCILLNQVYNINEIIDDRVIRVNTWDEIVKIILG